MIVRVWLVIDWTCVGLRCGVVVSPILRLVCCGPVDLHIQKAAAEYSSGQFLDAPYAV